MAVRQNKSAFGTDVGTEATHGTLPNNPGSYSGAIAAGDLNQNISRQVDDASTFLIRFLIQCDGNSQAANAAPQFEYSKNSGGFVAITTTSANIKAVTPTAFANAAHTTLRMGGSGSTDATNQGCTTDGLAGGAQMDIPANGQMETICGVQLVPADLQAGDTLDLRISGPISPITSYDFIPRITITAGAVPFTGTPGTGGATATGQAPELSNAHVLETALGALALTGLEPTLAAHFTAEPSVGTLAATGFEPTVEITGGVTAEPAAAALTATGLAPTVTAGSSFEATAEIAVLAFAGLGPTIATAQVITAELGALAATGLAPIVNTGLIATLVPNALLASSNLRDSNLVSPPVRLEDLTDETGSPDAFWWTPIDPNGDIEVRLGFQNPPGNLVGTQTIRVLIRGTSLPSRNITAALYEGGAPAPGSPTVQITEAVNSVSGQVVQLTFQPSDLAGNGDDVELLITATAA
jgi:hypothetical protein